MVQCHYMVPLTQPAQAVTDGSDTERSEMSGKLWIMVQLRLKYHGLQIETENSRFNNRRHWIKYVSHCQVKFYHKKKNAFLPLIDLLIYLCCNLQDETKYSLSGLSSLKQYIMAIQSLDVGMDDLVVMVKAILGSLRCDVMIERVHTGGVA